MLRAGPLAPKTQGSQVAGDRRTSPNRCAAPALSLDVRGGDPGVVSDCTLDIANTSKWSNKLFQSPASMPNKGRAWPWCDASC